MIDGETITSDGEKWRIFKLFKEFFYQTPLSKGHLEVIEQNYKQELSQLLEELRDECNNFTKSKYKKLDNELDDLSKKIKKMNKSLDKIKWWLNGIKWFCGAVGASVIGLVVTAIAKVL